MTDTERALNRLATLRQAQDTRIKFFRLHAAQDVDPTSSYQEATTIALEQSKIDGFAEALHYLQIDTPTTPYGAHGRA